MYNQLFDNHTVELKVPRLGFIMTVSNVRLLKFGRWISTDLNPYSLRLGNWDKRIYAAVRLPSGSGSDLSVLV